MFLRQIQWWLFTLLYLFIYMCTVYRQYTLHSIYELFIYFFIFHFYFHFIEWNRQQPNMRKLFTITFLFVVHVFFIFYFISSPFHCCCCCCSAGCTFFNNKINILDLCICCRRKFSFYFIVKISVILRALFLIRILFYLLCFINKRCCVFSFGWNPFVLYTKHRKCHRRQQMNGSKWKKNNVLLCKLSQKGFFSFYCFNIEAVNEC